MLLCLGTVPANHLPRRRRRGGVTHVVVAGVAVVAVVNVVIVLVLRVLHGNKNFKIFPPLT